MSAQTEPLSSATSRVTLSEDERVDSQRCEDGERINLVPGHFAEAHHDASLRPEKDRTFTEALKLYPRAAGWSVFFSLGVVMLAFDPQLLGNLYAMPTFMKDFGVPDANGEYLIPFSWQSALSIGNPLGQCLGALFAAYPMDLYGRKTTFIACVLLTTVLIFLQFFAISLRTLLAGELLSGLVLGAYVVIAPAYASEVCPLALRGVSTAWTNFCFVVGQLLANSVTAATKDLEGRWPYRLPFACQWIWCIIILPGVLFAPESPWWLVRCGRHEEARQALRDLSSAEADVDATLVAIAETNKLEQTDATYRDCFTKHGGNRLRTEIGVGVYTIQTLSGIYLINFGTLFFELAGLDTGQAFDMGVGFLAAGLVASMVSWILMGYAGRRTIYLTGLAIMAALQMFVGIFDCMSPVFSRATIAWTQCALMLTWNFVYNLSIGPICFVILCEVSATKVRAKTIAIATAVQAALGIVMTVAIPILMDPDGRDLRGKMGFIWGLLAAASFAWACIRVPETRWLTYRELDAMFHSQGGMKISTDYGTIPIERCDLI